MFLSNSRRMDRAKTYGTDLWDVVVDAAGFVVGRERGRPARTGAVTAHCAYRTTSRLLKSRLTKMSFLLFFWTSERCGQGGSCDVPAECLIMITEYRNGQLLPSRINKSLSKLFQCFVFQLTVLICKLWHMPMQLCTCYLFSYHHTPVSFP